MSKETDITELCEVRNLDFFPQVRILNWSQESRFTYKPEWQDIQNFREGDKILSRDEPYKVFSWEGKVWIKPARNSCIHH